MTTISYHYLTGQLLVQFLSEKHTMVASQMLTEPHGIAFPPAILPAT